MKSLIYFDFQTLDGDVKSVEENVPLSLPFNYYALRFTHEDTNGNGRATLRIFDENHEMAKIEYNGWSVSPIIDFTFNWQGNDTILVVTDPNGYVFEIKKWVDTRKGIKDKPLPLTPFLVLKELQQFNSGMEYELKLENERLEITITKLKREIEALNKELKGA